MAILAPLFLLGALAIALPIWLHRLQARSSNRRAFSSTMLLEATDEQVHVKKEFRYLLLLALRILLLLLLAFAFAKPFLERPPGAAADAVGGTHLVVVDTSVSMGRSGLFDQALEQARRAIEAAPSNASIQVAAADGGLRMLSEPSADKSSHRAALRALVPGALRLDVGSIMAAIGHHADTLPAPVTLHLVSDFQASAMPAQFARAVPSGIAALLPHVVGTGEPANWAVEFVAETADGLDISVRGYGMPDRAARVEMTVNGAPYMERSVTGQGRHRLSFPYPALEPGDNRIEVALDTDDDLDIDNRWYSVVRNAPPIGVPIITRDPDGLPVTYLSAALESATDLAWRVEPLRVGEFDPRVLSRYRWAIVDDIGVLDAALAARVQEFLSGGGNVLAFAADRALGAETLPVTGHRLAAASLVSGAERFLTIGQLDAEHPVLSASDGWHRVNVSRSFPIEVTADDAVLMRLENDEPFMLERAMGDGRLLLLLNGIDNRWSDLPVRPVFVGFVLEAARYLSGSDDGISHVTTGAALPLSLVGSASGQVVAPDGRTLLALEDTARAQSVRLDEPGIYEVHTTAGSTLVAANVDPLESDFARVSQAVLDDWRDATHSDVRRAGGQIPTGPADPLELWPWLLLMAAVVAIAEAALGNVHASTRARMIR